MKKGTGLILAAMIFMGCFMTPAYAAPLQLLSPLAGEVAYPEGSAVDSAKFLLTYAYPQVTPETDTDTTINAFYQELLDDLTQLTAPMMYDEASASLDDGVSAYMHINYQIMANTDEFFSVLLTQEQFMGVAESQTLLANVFARTGDSAGGLVTLPYILGISEEDEASATKLVDAVYRLVWDIIVEQMQTGTVDYFEELTEENLFAEFYPESDFYLDEQGNIVFFVQPATVANAAAGALSFPFSPDELRNEMNKN